MVKKILFHLIGALHFFYGCFYDYNYVIVPRTEKSAPSYGGKFKYLTFLDAMVQTTYFTVALLNDFFGTNEPAPAQKPLIRRIKDLAFCALAFPLSMFVGTTFWGIYAVDRELILPRSLDEFFPLWLNHVMHTNIMIFTFIEMVTSFRMYPKRKLGMSILTLFMLCYVVWLHVIYFETGGWVYPILSVLSWPLRIAFYVFSLVIVFSLYVFGERLNGTVWSREVEKTVRSGKKKPQ